MRVEAARMGEAVNTPIISVDKVCYSYDGVKNALRNVTLDIGQGEFVALLGSNGSGKSTLAKHMNSLFKPDSGQIQIAGLSTSDGSNDYEIRCNVGLVFQNPDDQMVSSIVEADVAFGPENLGLAPDEIRKRVYEALSAVAMSGYARANPAELSGGQKQRVSIAGVLAMRPKAVVLDEPGAMLDPRGRRAVRRVCKELHARGIAIVLITHFMQEALLADRVVVMHEGKVALQGTPQEVFTHERELEACSLDVPLSIKLCTALERRGVSVKRTTDLDELEGELCRLRSSM